MASEKTPRSIRTTEAPAELNRGLGRTATLKHSPINLPIASPRINPHWSDLRRALPVVPEVR